MTPSASLLEGLTVRRFVAVTALCAAAALAVVRLFYNTYWDLLVSALCVGYTCMVLFTLAGNLRQRALPRELAQVIAIVVGSFLGTVLAGLVKGRALGQMFSERLAGVMITMGLGIGVGCVVVAALSLREKHARDQARILRAESERHQLEKNVLEARLALMQAQVEPHFLFNTLANVSSLVDRDPREAKRMLERFIGFLRASLAATRTERTTLGAERELVAAYLDLLQVRMGSRLAYTIDIAPELESFALAPMLVQPIIENAIRHGLEPKMEGGSVELRARREGDAVVIEVRDSGVGFAAGANGGFGIANVRERLSGLYGERGRLEIAENRPAGTIVTLRIPA